MTKRREQQEKEHQGRAKEKTKHDLASDAHRESAAESAPKKKSSEDVNQADRQRLAKAKIKLEREVPAELHSGRY